jgi:hypothetical protein
MMSFWYAIANNSFVAPLLLMAGTALILYTSTRSVSRCLRRSSADAGRQSPARRQFVAG